jgi:MFS family permease
MKRFRGMTTARERFYGWVIVGSGIVVTCVGVGAMLSLTVFLQPMSEAMGWSRSGISTAALVNWICMGVGAFAWGALSDRFGTRAVVLAGGVLLGVGLVSASRAATLGQFQALFGVTVGFAAGSFYTPMTATTTRWFTRHRSLAVALVSAGLSVGSGVMVPLARWLITTYDWRVAMLVLGDVVWLVVIPAALLVREPPPATSAASSSSAAGAEEHDMTVGQALRTPQFTAIALTYFACCAAHSGPIFHMVTHAIDHGVPAMAAATVLSAASLASLSGKIVCGLVADRVGAKRTLVAGLAIQALAVSLYLITHELATFYAVAFVFGFAYGGVMPLYAILVREYFGPRIMGTVFGAAALASTLGMAIGPVAGGALYDTLGSYAWLFVGSSAIGLGAVAIALTFRPPRLATVARLSPAVH